MLAQRVNKRSGEKEWCLLSKSSPGKVLEWFGKKKPSPETVQKSEARVQYYKHK